MALIREGRALLAGDKIEPGNRSIAQARASFEKLRAEGNTSEPVTYGLALALFTPYLAWGPIGGPASKPTDLPQAVELTETDRLRAGRVAPGEAALRGHPELPEPPAAEGARASLRARRAARSSPRWVRRTFPT